MSGLDLQRIRSLATKVANDVARDERERTEQDRAWPAETMRALADEGLLGLLVPQSAGGLGGNFRAVVAVTEALGHANPSAGLVFGMHCVGTACIAARATPEQTSRYLEPIARGEHVTTLALSEKGTGVHFYLPGLRARRDGNAFVLTGEKAFVTSGGHADSYVVSTAPLDGSEDVGRFNLLVVDRGTEGLRLGEPWMGLGMRGNDARSLTFDEARVRGGSLLGEEGAQTWYMFEVVMPNFIVGMAGAYLGLTQRAFDESREHLVRRRRPVLGRTLAEEQGLQQDLARMWLALEQARLLLYNATASADDGRAEAALNLMASKACLDDVAAEVTETAMTIGGGHAYQDDGILASLLRDARASRVMAPTAPLLRTWIARSLLGLPLLTE